MTVFIAPSFLFARATRRTPSVPKRRGLLFAVVDGDAPAPGTGVSADAPVHYSEGGCQVTVAGLTMWLAGDVDISNCDTITRAATELIGNVARAKRRTADGLVAVLDVERLEFIDAAGLSAVVEAHRALADVGIGLRTIHASAQLRRLSTICQLNHLLGLGEDVAPQMEAP